MSDEIIKKILKRFGIQEAAVRSPQKGYRNSSYLIEAGGKKYNLMVYKRGSETLRFIRAAHEIGLHLRNSSFPVRYPVDERILKVFQSSQPTYACLYNYLDGDTIPWEAYTTKHLLNLGMTLGNLHGALVDFVPHTLPKAHITQKKVAQRMDMYIQRPGVQDALTRKLKLDVDFRYKSYIQLFDTLGTSKHAQSLHMDFVRGNILFDEHANITGIIDFEKAAYDHPLFDVARTSAFLLVDCKFKEDVEVMNVFFNRGYQKRGGMPLPRIMASGDDRTLEVLDQLITFFLLHDFYKFLLHNPYENLEANEHFVRTRDQLLKRNVLTSI